jgi:hypothetical protein
VLVLSAAFLVLVGVVGGIGFFGASAAGAAVQAPVGGTTVGLAGARAPVDWDDAKTMHTVARDPGGTFKFDRKTGRVQVCDREEDGHFVRGTVTVGGDEVVNLRAGENGKCYEDATPAVCKSKGKVRCKFEICLDFGEEWKEGHCNTSNNREWPKVDRDEGYCHGRSSAEERTDCVGEEEKAESAALKPPVGRTPNTAPITLPRGHADGVGDVTAPVGTLLRWLLWFVLGACVMGFMLVGGNMALKHKRGEAGAHASGLGWVLIACVLAGSGLAMGFISLLFDPL